MQPYQPGPRRKDLRRALRGIPDGHRATRPDCTAYGRRQRRRDYLALWAAFTPPPARI